MYFARDREHVEAMRPTLVGEDPGTGDIVDWDQPILMDECYGWVRPVSPIDKPDGWWTSTEVFAYVPGTLYTFTGVGRYRLRFRIRGIWWSLRGVPSLYRFGALRHKKLALVAVRYPGQNPEEWEDEPGDTDPGEPTSDPAPPANVRIPNWTDTMIIIRWDEPVEHSYPIELYRVYDADTEEVVGTDDGTNMGVQLTGLQPGTRYTFTVTAVDDQGTESDHSPPVSQTTEEA